MMSSLGVVFNLGDTESQLSPRVWMMSSLGAVLNLGEIRFAAKSFTH
jgi:hypothetical protein